MPAPWTCPNCAAAYWLRLFTCPRCRAFPERYPMPKISRNGGPSNFAANPEPVSVPVEEVGEQPSPGSSSSPSPVKPESSPPPTPDPSPAPATENPSSKGRTGNGSVRGTGGGRTAKGSK